MTPTIRSLLAALAAAVPAPLLAASAKLPEPVTYTKPVPGADLVFVMHGSPESEAKLSPTSQAEVRELRQKYPRSGLYRGGSGELVWSVDGPFAPPDAVFLTSDGRHLIRIEGDWWREKDFAGQKRLPDEVAQAQLDAPAVSFFENGTLLKQYRLRDLVTRPDKLPHSPKYVLWVAGAVLNEDTGRFLLFVQDSTRLTFDTATGDLVTRQEAGLGNPATKPILLAAGVMAALILAVWAWFVFVKWQRPAA